MTSLYYASFTLYFAEAAAPFRKTARLYTEEKGHIFPKGNMWPNIELAALHFKAVAPFMAEKEGFEPSMSY